LRPNFSSILQINILYLPIGYVSLASCPSIQGNSRRSVAAGVPQTQTVASLHNSYISCVHVFTTKSPSCHDAVSIMQDLTAIVSELFLIGPL
jgi:hypothetical protein